MIETEILLVFAELGVAFAGFASVVSVVAGGKLTKLPVDYRWSLRGMLVCSLSVSFLAIIPIVLERFELQVHQTWQISGAALGTVCVVLMIGGIRDSQMIASTLDWRSRAAWVLPIVAVCMIGISLAVSIFVEHAAAVYLSALVALLLLSAALFGNIVMSQVAPRD